MPRSRMTVAIETRGLRELNPFFDAAGARAVAIVIDDALAPGAAEGRIVAAREDDGVLDGNDALVVVAIERPGLQLAARQFAFVHQQVERMLVVVALGADGSQALFEFGGRQQFCCSDRQSVISIPSQATSQPDSFTHPAFGARVVQDRICVVDVNENLARR